jgi:acyl-coenzyme A synthetase/AMP-(fatty) acid ligase
MTILPLSLVAPGGPAEVAVRGPNGVWSRAELAARACAVARRLSQREETQWVVLTPDRRWFAVAVAACAAAGKVVVLPGNLQAETMERLRRGGAGFLGVDTGCDVDLREAMLPAGAALPGVPADRVLARIWTSGSTGAPKAVDKRADQLLGEARALVDAFELRPDDVVLATMPSHHIYGLLFGILLPLQGGGVIVDATPLHAEVVAEVVHRERVTVLVSTPAHLRALEVLAPGRLPGVRLVFSSSAPLPTATAHMLHERFGVEVTEVLGSTETGGMAWRRSRAGALPEVWSPLPGVELEVSQDGRLVLRSGFLAPDALPWPSDDRARPVAGGGFVHLGRMDDVVKVGGKRVALSELERAAREVPGVRDTAAWWEDGSGARGGVLHLAVAGTGVTATQIRAVLEQRFDPVVLPRRIYIVAALPREPTGKLRRASLEGLAPRRVQLHVPAELWCFDGHFPGQPVLPGVAQLELFVVPEVRRAWPDLGPVQRISRLKFKRTIAPGDDLELVLERRGESGRVEFDLRRDGESCASGVLLVGVGDVVGER